MNWKAHAGDIMAGAGGAGGPAPDVRHQPQQGNAGVLPAMPVQNQIDLYHEQTEFCINARGAVVSAALRSA